MAQYLNPVVAEVSHNLYSAAKTAGLSSAETNQINQMSFTIKQHRELAALDPNEARQRYQKLTPDAQQALKFMYKEADYMKEPESLTRKFFGTIGNVAHLAASPLIGLIKVGGQYNRIINEPYKVFRDVQEGAEFWNKKTWTDAWQGVNQWDHQGIAKAENYFGKQDVYVAKGLLEGKTPGEIVEAYGTADSALLDSLKKAFNKPDDFKQVMDAVKYSQISFGRDVARMFATYPPKGGGLHGDYVSGTTKNLSGILDFTYQIAIDPLTWMSGGASKLVTRGDRIANTVLREVETLGTEKAVSNLFKDPKVSNFWNNEIGPRVQRYAEAPKGSAEQTAAFTDIARRYPAFNNRAAIDALAHPEAKVFDAASAEKYANNAVNLQRMMSGRVDGISYITNGIATARSNRLMSEGLGRYLDSVFNHTEGATLGGLKTTGRDTAALEEAGKPIERVFLDSADLRDRWSNPDADVKALQDATESIRGWKNATKVIGKQLSRSAAGLEVRTGEFANLTAANFTARARLVLPKDMAELLTSKFLASAEDEQYVILRNLDTATMYAMGLGGDVRGTELMERILTEKYGGKAGFATKVESGVSAEHAAIAPENALTITDGNTHVNNLGPIHFYQSRHAVGSLPFDEIGSTAWAIKSKKNIINAVGGATQGNFSKRLVDTWSILTLFPRLGIRSAIDEATMFLLTAPARDLWAFVSRRGNKMATAAKKYTGSVDGTGPIRAGIQKVFKLGNRSGAINYVGRRLEISPETALSDLRRRELISDYAKEKNLEVDALDNLQKREAIAAEVFKDYGRYMGSEEDVQHLMEVFVHQPDALHAAANSVIARSGLSGAFEKEALGIMITESALDAALKETGIEYSRGTHMVNMRALAEGERGMVHFEKYYKVFVGNRFTVGKGDKARTVLNPSEVFFKHEGLAGENMKKAIDESMAKVGFKYNDMLGAWVTADKELVKEFNSLSAHSVEGRAAGLSEAQIAEAQLFRMYHDMYVTFHGDGMKFNQELYNAVKSSHAWLIDNGVEHATYGQAIARMTMDDFIDLSTNNRLAGDVTTSLAVGDFRNTENMFKKYGNNMMEAMDRQVNGIFRQPAVMVAYTGLRKKYKALENAHAEQIYIQKVGKAWEHTLPEAKRAEEKAIAADIAARKFTEIALRDAADNILKYADNPNVRTNFAYSMRTMGRYYRATEDFYRRLYRMKDVTPRALYRLRLTNVGLGATGFVHKDQNGDQYIMMPMDNIIFKATEAPMRILTGDSQYKQPQFSQFTMKLRMMNPSFAQDSGLPTLSGPLAALSVIGLRDILGRVPNTDVQVAAQQLDNFALGNIGDNIDVTHAIVPASLQRVYSILNADEKNRQEITAGQQAMAYNAAHGINLDPNATPEQKAQYIKNTRIAAHNIVAMRNLLGMIAPVSPVAMDSTGVPDYLKNVGITNLRGEFYDILNSISKVNNGDITDPYEQALATFIGKNPGKLVYTVSTSTKESKVLIKNTDGLKNWAITNQGMIDKYGETAYIFAPQTGQFNSATYNWIQAAGLIQSKSLEKYYDDLLVAHDRQAYYDLARNEKQALANTSDSMERANIINTAARERASLLTGNPMLKPALIGQGNNIGTQELMLNSLEHMVGTKDTPIEPATRQRMSTAIKLVNSFIAFSKNPTLSNVSNGAELKAERRQQVEAALKELMLGDAYVTEANRAIFSAILNFYSRDSYYVFREMAN